MITWCWYLAFMASIMDASVVLLPEPVCPVTSTSPRGRSTNDSMAGGRLSWLSGGTLSVMARKAMATVSRW